MHNKDNGRQNYRQTCYMGRTLVGNQIVDHTDVVGESHVDAAPNTSSFSTWHMVLIDSTTRRGEKRLGFGNECALYYRFNGNQYIFFRTQCVIYIIPLHSSSRCEQNNRMQMHSVPIMCRHCNNLYSLSMTALPIYFDTPAYARHIRIFLTHPGPFRRLQSPKHNHIS